VLDSRAQDTKEARHLKTYEVSVKDKDFVDGPWQHSNLDAGASIVIPIPSPLCGVVVVGENSVAYLHGACPRSRLRRAAACAHKRVRA